MSTELWCVSGRDQIGDRSAKCVVSEYDLRFVMSEYDSRLVMTECNMGANEVEA